MILREVPLPPGVHAYRGHRSDGEDHADHHERARHLREHQESEQGGRHGLPAGGQEKGKRGGTENLPAISALRVAVEEWLVGREEKNLRAAALKERIASAVSDLGFQIISPEMSSPYILSYSGPLPSQVYTRMLSDRGVSVSSGSACSNNSKGEGEKILIAMGVRPDKARNAVRISLSNSTTEDDAENLIRIIREIGNGR